MLVDETGLLKRFQRMLPATGRALHLGTLRSNPEVSTFDRQKSWFPAGWAHHGLDVAEGPDVDLVADIHTLNEQLPAEHYDALVCCSVLEHLEFPWVASLSMSRVTKFGGLIYVQTHQTFPIHGYPLDYYRFSREALVSLFSRHTARWEPIAVGYEFPCTITPPGSVTEWNAAAESYLNSCLIARRI